MENTIRKKELETVDRKHSERKVKKQSRENHMIIDVCN